MATFLRPVSPFSVEVPSVHVFISFLAHRQVGGLWLQFPLSNHKQKVNTRVEEHSSFPCHVEFAAATILGKALKHGDLSPRGGICCLYQSGNFAHTGWVFSGPSQSYKTVPRSCPPSLSPSPGAGVSPLHEHSNLESWYCEV